MNPHHLFTFTGGSNSYRARLWKYALYKKICQSYGIGITVCHYPPGASKWNPADHRLFSFISMNWAGVPLRSYDILLNHIRRTTTQQGLKVDAILNETSMSQGLTKEDENPSKHWLDSLRKQGLKPLPFGRTPGPGLFPGEKAYEKGIKISDDQMREVKLKYHKLLPKWNYTISL